VGKPDKMRISCYHSGRGLFTCGSAMVSGPILSQLFNMQSSTRFKKALLHPRRLSTVTVIL
jgi:hypothetical protein